MRLDHLLSREISFLGNDFLTGGPPVPTLSVSSRPRRRGVRSRGPALAYPQSRIARKRLSISRGPRGRKPPGGRSRRRHRRRPGGGGGPGVFEIPSKNMSGTVEKMSRAHGGCLGTGSRRRARQAAIIRGEGHTPFDPRVPEWGNPARFMARHPQANPWPARGRPGELKHLSTRRNGNQPRLPE